MEPITADEAKFAHLDEEDSTIEPMITAETGEAPAATLSKAEEIARRVFAAPVEGETEPTGPHIKDLPFEETEQLASATSNTEAAPVVLAEKITAPVTEITTAVDTQRLPNTTVSAEGLSSSHVTPKVVPAATTETTVSGPATPKSQKEKDTGKVSSWLKTKFSRRASKPSNSSSSTAHPTISEPRDPKVFVGGANLGAPDINTGTSSDMGDSSMHEVAMAGKEAGPVDAPVVSPASFSEPQAAGALGERTSSSTSISSLSSDEDMRGRSAIRLADTIPGNQHQPLPIFGTTAATHDRPAAVAQDSMIGEPIDPTLLPHTGGGTAGRQSSSMGGTTGTEEFEEARDEFDSEKLVPPEKGIVGSEGRKSDSPARDSKFVEEL